MKKVNLLGMSALMVLAPSAFAGSVDSSKEVIKDATEFNDVVVSQDMIKVVQRLESDWSFIAKFLNHPQDALRDYDLTEDEYMALTTRNTTDLMSLGISEQQVAAAMSGTHRGGGRFKG